MGLSAMGLINVGLIGRRSIRDGAYYGGSLLERVGLIREVGFDLGLPRSAAR